jgi:FAD/FMN-containing dehydrogenase
MTEAVNTQTLSGWGRFPREECHVYRPEKRISLERIFTEDNQPDYIARGLGRSYGDPALNRDGGVISFARLNRILEFDEESGVVNCEAGVTFPDLLDTFLPRGFFIPVTPGTKFITVGGAIANDVHGKNHHRDGSFGHSLISFEMLLVGGEVVACSREENADLFWATVGGIGLTGILLTARFRLRRVESAYIVVDYQKTRDLDGVLSAIDEDDEKYQYSVAWIDCLARGRNLGRAVLMRGNHASASSLPPGRSDPFVMKDKFKPTVPFDLPQILLNSVTMGAFNKLYYALSSGKQGRLADCDSYFFPLDVIHNWNRGYGKRGFVQYQVTVPLTERQGLVELLESVSASGRASFLAVLKKFGPGNDGLLSHPFEGYTLTMDFAVNDALPEFLQGLDAITLNHGGRLYLAKDAVMSPDTFNAMCPRRDEFLAVKNRVDPENRLSSSLARRIGLVPGRPQS